MSRHKKGDRVIANVAGLDCDGTIKTYAKRLNRYRVQLDHKDSIVYVKPNLITKLPSLSDSNPNKTFRKER